MGRTLHAVSALALVLAGCAAAPQLQAPAPIQPDAAARWAGPASALSEAPVPAQWWRLFHDDTLGDLQAEAARSNLDLQAAAQRVSESRALLGLAQAVRWPQVAAEASQTRSALSAHSPLVRLGAPTAPSSSWTLGLQAGWELDLWGRLRHLDEAAGARLDASAFGMAAARVSVAGEVARTYLLLRGAQAQIAIGQENRRIAAELVRLADSRQRNGVATRQDAAAARASLAGIEARLSQRLQQRDNLANALALLLGMPPGALDARLAGAGMPAMPQRLPVGVPSDLARNRPDILQAEARLRAAVADIGAAQADFYPRIGLAAGIGYQAAELSDLGSWSARRFAIGPTLHLPVFQGGRLVGMLALAEARHRAAGIAYRQTVLGAWHEVSEALTAHRTERARHGQLEAALAQGRVALDVARRAYRQGTADFTSVLVAHRALLAGEAELADCATASALSVVALYRALGGGWSAALQADAATPQEEGP